MMDSLEKGARQMRVIAKAYADQPLDRQLTGIRGEVVYVTNPSTGNANGTPRFSGVGFPADCVFEFDAELFDSLTNAWKASEVSALAMLWGRARPINVSAIAA